MGIPTAPLDMTRAMFDGMLCGDYEQAGEAWTGGMMLLGGGVFGGLKGTGFDAPDLPRLPSVAGRNDVVPTDLYFFGSAGGPAAPRLGIEYFPNDDGIMPAQYGKQGATGKSSFGDPLPMAIRFANVHPRGY